MYICEYCGRYLKKKYEKCPACGSNKYKKVQNIGEVIIKEPPKDGYHVNLKNFKYERKGHWPGIVLGAWVLVIGLGCFMPLAYIIFPEDDKESISFKIILFFFIIFMLIPIIKMSFMFFGKSKEIIQSSNKDIRKVKHLAKNGMLIKNLKYKVVPIKGQVHGAKTVYKIQVIYEIEKGKTKCFESEPKYLTALGRDDGTVDLLIDPKDYKNYFIDFEIY